ncbi:MAG: heavy metal sensor histidine kinase [Desulfobacterota bacterium]|nr:heavy metal sensor histidine kinase [Thermodesulfobacteriota bacterium]
MFWKSGNGAGLRLLSQPSASITYRLTLLYMFSAGIILLLAIGFLFYAFVKTLEENNIELLHENVRNIREALYRDPDDLTALNRQLVTGAEPQFIKYYARVLREDGSVVVATPDNGFALPYELFPQPVAAGILPEKAMRYRTPEGKKFLLVAAWAHAGGRHMGERYLVQAALDVSWERSMIRRYRLKAQFIFLAGILTSALAAIMVARRALRPLDDITRTIRRIKATQLNERVTQSRWPRELAELATSFDEMLNRLEDSFARLSQFSFDLAHELRTPINNLMGEAEVALAKPRTVEEYQEILASSLEEYRGLLRMIEGLLFLARADSSDIVIEHTRLEAEQEIRALLDYYDAMIREKRLRVTLCGTAAVFADQVLLRRVLNNVLSNAIKYTPEDGTLDISITRQQNGTVCIEFQDSGIGIAPDELNQIGNRFYRSELSKRLDPKGAGLGLSIAKSIMALHGGSIDIKSNLGAGTCVRLLFPSTAI